MPANCLAPITKCAYKKEQQQIKEEAFQDGDFTQKAHQYLSSPDVLENILHISCEFLTPDLKLKVTWGIGLSVDNRSLITQSWVLPACLCHLLFTQSSDVTFHIPKQRFTLQHTFSVA